MQMSAGLRRNSVWRPRCAVMVAANGGIWFRPRLHGCCFVPQRSCRIRVLGFLVGAVRVDIRSCDSPFTICAFSQNVLMRILQRVRQLGVSAVVGQHEDHRRVAPGTVARSRITLRCPFAPMRPRLQPEDLRHHIAALRGGEQRPETIALASATPRSRSSRHRLRKVLGAHPMIRAISS